MKYGSDEAWLRPPLPCPPDGAGSRDESRAAREVGGAAAVPGTVDSRTLEGGEGMVKAEKPAGPDDDDLTSLTWLQDKNLLKGMNLRTANNVGAHGSPTSDYVDEGSCCSTGELPASDSSGCSSSGRSPASPSSAIAVAMATTATAAAAAGLATTPVSAASVAVMAARSKHPQHMPYDPLVHITSKPPYSFSCLIFMAIEDSPGHALPVKEIYAWILDHFPYFKNAPTGWKNSVRHNLSLNKCFRKVEKAPQNLGKGSLWMVDPMYRPNLVQALAKSPFHPYTTIISRTASMNSSSNSSSPNSGSVPSTPTKAPLSPSCSSHQQTPTSASSSSSSSSSSGSSGSSTTSSVNSNVTTATNNSNSNSSTSSSNSTSNHNNNNNIPDPALFPFLSRRLALSAAPLSGSSTPSSQPIRDDSLEDVDAAAAMLALKHAHLRIPRKDDWYKRLREETSEAAGLRKRVRTSSRPGQTDERMVITTSPSEDHTYSAALNLSARSPAAVATTPVTSHGVHAPPSTTSSPDEAFEEGSDSDDGTDGKNSRPRHVPTGDNAHSTPITHRFLYDRDRGDTSDEERRKIAEGADALLNLAGIRTDGGAVSPPTSLVTLNAALPPRNLAPSPQTSQLSAAAAYAGSRSRRRKKPPRPSSRAVATQKQQYRRPSSGHGGGSHNEKRGGSSASARR